ncbi:MAG: VOC family protein [Gemmatimonadaceae bacterium]
MLIGAHTLVYTTDPEADRDFFRDVLEFPFVDTGGNWLIFKMPPSEMALHPMEALAGGAEAMMRTELYFMCDDLDKTMAELSAKGVECDAVTEERWGKRTMVVLPSGGKVGLYHPFHDMAISL